MNKKNAKNLIILFVSGATIPTFSVLSLRQMSLVWTSTLTV